MKKNKIILGGLIHDREWLLPYFLRSVSQIEGIDKIVFLSNNNSEETLQALAKVGMIYKMDNVESTADRTSSRYHTLVKLRNRLLDIVFRELEADYLLSLDSDVLPAPQIVKNLLSFEKDFISALVYNDIHFSNPNKKNQDHIGNIMSFSNSNKNHFKHICPIIRNILLPVDLTGAIALISKKVYQSGARFAYHRQGEDAGFCLSVKTKGIQLYCLTQLQIHVMTKQILTKYIQDGIIEEIKEK